MKKRIHTQSEQAVAHEISRGALAVIPTDTLYGIVASVYHPQTIERLYEVRHRDKKKSCIVLIDSPQLLKPLLSDEDFYRYEELFSLVWPGSVSVAIPDVGSDVWSHIGREQEALAFRVPDNKELRAFLEISGPIVAPSANTQGNPPAQTIEEAKAYFGAQVDAYMDGGKLSGEPSTLIRPEKDDIVVLREGAVNSSMLQARLGRSFHVISL